MIVLTFIGLSTLMFSSKVNAQTLPQRRVVTLQQAIRQVTDSSLNIQSAAYQVEMQRLLKHTAWDIGKTNIDIEYGQLNSNQKDNNISISQSFAFPTVYSNQYKLAKASVKNSELGFSVTRAEKISIVKSTYYQLVYYYSKLNLLRYQDSLFTNLSVAAARREKSGETNLLEKVSAESQSQEVKNLIRQTRG